MVKEWLTPDKRDGGRWIGTTRPATDFRDLGKRYPIKLEPLAPAAKRIVDKMSGKF
jgi:hypothetical protein